MNFFLDSCSDIEIAFWIFWCAKEGNEIAKDEQRKRKIEWKKVTYDREDRKQSSKNSQKTNRSWQRRKFKNWVYARFPCNREARLFVSVKWDVRNVIVPKSVIRLPDLLHLNRCFVVLFFSICMFIFHLEFSLICCTAADTIDRIKKPKKMHRKNRL